MFGLVHGAGFAGYLHSLFTGSIAVPLLGFNLGIELGQMAVLAVAGPRPRQHGSAVGPPAAGRGRVHTSVTEIVQEVDGRSLRSGTRLFTDDLATVIGAPPSSAGADSLISTYVQRRFVVADGAGSPVPLQWDTSELVGDLVQVRLRATTPWGLAGVHVANGVRRAVRTIPGPDERGTRDL